MRRGILLGLLASFVALVLGEGLYSLLYSARLKTSISYRTYTHLRDHLGWRAAPDPSEPNSTVLHTSVPIRRLIGAFQEDGVGIGNGPFRETRTDKSRMNDDLGDYEVQRPNLDKVQAFLRAGFYEPFNLVTAFHDYGATLSPEVREFLDSYGTGRIRYRTNERGERLTLPAVEADEKVIVAGDSIANGALVNDDETLASRLQSLDPHRQYVNIGIYGADARTILPALERAAARYTGRIAELIYVYCENDFKSHKKWGSPDEVVPWLREFVGRENIPATTIIFAPYVYNVVPHITRLRGGYVRANHETHVEERRRLRELAEAARFRFVDVTELALAEIERTGTEFGALLLFVDIAHWSPVGTARIAEHLRNTGAG